MKRNDVEAIILFKHWLWTLDGTEDVECWSYIQGSAPSGERIYKTENGRVRRLGASGTKRSALSFVFEKTGAGVAAVAAAALADQDDTLAYDLRAASTFFFRVARRAGPSDRCRPRV
eukprot:TRINITY_DN19619_c0_g1_i1.p4 TRINITY_DN19619_c0_g1~~TRINITY_DN19619_c0_g1_i1.p4  ORF type:complete len:117 (-),score=17.43 TRINITY_DN19619_c0_g1_i1:282-632(-)